MEVLNARLRRVNGSLYGTIWVVGWLLPCEFLKPLSELVKPLKILSYSSKYIEGYRGKETQITFLAVKVKEKEVEDEGKET
jgi:hypothetical protein